MDWRDITDEKEKYQAYLCSPEWGQLRRQVHERCKGVCERCHSSPVDAVHHLTYARRYAELLTDLQGICNGCHEFTHGKSETDPAAGMVIFNPARWFADGHQHVLCPICGSEELRLGEQQGALPEKLAVSVTCNNNHTATFKLMPFNGKMLIGFIGKAIQ